MLFEDNYCRIFDATNQEILRDIMRGKNSSFNPTKGEYKPEFVDNQELQLEDVDQANYKTKDELANLFTKSIPAKSRICSS